MSRLRAPRRLPAFVFAAAVVAAASPVAAGDAPEAGPPGAGEPAIEARIERLKVKAQAARTIADHESVVADFLAAIDRVILEKGHKEASGLTSVAEAAARELRSSWPASRVERYRAILKASRKEIDEAAPATAKLARRPDDPIALRTVGKLECFVLDRWDDGLPRLARGIDEKLARAAARDLEGPPDGRGQLELGDLWSAVADGEKGPGRDAARGRAVHWYGKGSASAGETERARIAKLAADLPSRWLADLEETGVQVGWGKFCKDGTLHTEGEVRVNGIPSRRALFFHPPNDGTAKVLYKLGKRYRALDAHVALADKGEKFGSTLTFQVVGDGKLLWKSAPIARPGTSQAFKPSLAGVDVLELQVICRGPNAFGFAVWLDPKIVR